MSDTETKPKSRGRRSKEKNEKETLKQEQELKLTQDSIFFGLVDSSELDYFKQAESTLNINAFDNDNDRKNFITSVLLEAKGKELKLVTNQICSKLMERLILFASNKQLKSIFVQFSSHFVPLSQHKYSSHVLETLLIRSSALVEKEILQEDEDEDENEDENEDEQDKTPMETLMNSMFDEFNPFLKSMIDHQYASHVLRLLILISAGKELPSSTMSNSTLRSKKSKIARKMIEIKDNKDFNKSFQVPNSFKIQLKNICNELIKNQQSKNLRELAINKIASPVLQLILQVEGKIDRERSFWHLLFSDTDDKVPQEEAFMEYLLSDPVGSHLLESCIKNDGVRLKYIERLYKLYIKHRVLKLAKRSSSGVYIIQALLFKLNSLEVEFILDQIIPELTNLISISDNKNLDLAQKIIDASITRNNYKRLELINQLFAKLAPNYHYKAPELDTSSEFLENVLQLAGSTLGNTKDDWPTAEERRRSLFLEKLMQYDYTFVVCVWLNFLAIPAERFIQMSTHGVFSHVVQQSLVVLPSTEKEPKSTLILRKRILNIFQNQVVKLACNSYGSHIIDKLWDFTVLLPMYKDKIASELLKESHKVKESTYGRLVWKNWGMELYTRKKYDWKTLIKQQDATYFGQTENGELNRAKKPIERKMERVAEERRIQEEKEGKRPRDDNDDNSLDSKKQKIRGRRRD